MDCDSRMRDEIAAGKLIGPRIIASNMAISVPRGHMAGSLAYEANSAEEARLLWEMQRFWEWSRNWTNL